MGPPKLPHMHSAYLLTPISPSTYPTLCFPRSFPPRHWLFPPPSDDIHCQVCQSPFDEYQMLPCDICDAGWHMDCLLPPLTTIPHGLWKCPLCLPRHLPESYPSQLLSTFVFLPPSSISTLIKMLHKKMTRYH